MAAARDYNYLDQPNLDLWKCDICTDPLIDPVFLPDPCDKTFCRQCIETNFDQHTSTCSECRQNKLSKKDIMPESRKIRRLLDQLRVQCKVCKASPIQRGNLADHLANRCPKRIVSCPAEDLGCSWQNTFSLQQQHVQSCHYENLRTLLQQMRKKNEELTERCDTLTNKCEALEKSNAEKQASIDQVSADLGQSQQQCADRQTLFDEREKLTTDIGLLRTNHDDLQKQFDQVKQESDQLATENQQLKELKDRQKAEIDLLTGDHQSLKQRSERQEIEKSRLITQCQQLEQQQMQLKQLLGTVLPEFQQMKPLFPQQQADIARLTAKTQTLETENIVQKNRISQDTDLVNNLKERMQRLEETLEPPYVSTFVSDCSEEDTSLYENEALEDLLSYCTNQGLINLSGQKLVDHDLNIIVRFAIQKKHCSKLVLSNNQIGLEGMKLMAPILYDCSTLTELNLSHNRLADTGARIVAQALTKHNRTLVALNLGNNEITDSAVLNLADMLEFNTSLRVLGLQENRIGDRGVVLLANVLRDKNRTLTELSLYSNPAITDTSVNPLIGMLQRNASLETLWLWKCQLSSRAQDQLRQISSSKENLDIRL